MDPAQFEPSLLPPVTRPKSKNIRIIYDGRAEYRDIPINEIFQLLTDKFYINIDKRLRFGGNDKLDAKIALIYEKMKAFIEESPELRYRLPTKPEWLN